LQSFLSAKSLKKRISAAIPHAAQHISIQNFDQAISKNKQIHFFKLIKSVSSALQTTKCKCNNTKPIKKIKIPAL
ncbi:hypothetical protein, partial [Flavobacterium psychrophilum]|uniref:hypothetical protein n=1 Tax=Flavobacterium psychrophilum TaxID=96345 RepID=UPI0033983025